ncbi:MAG: helix-turn-helix domain-containing protein [Clostridium sp.]|nr:helix-turn-helix domain-containing protein [Clostridium sp.]
MKTTLFMLLVALPILFLTIGGIVYLFILLCRALKRYINSSESRKEQATVKKSLGEVLKNHRTKNKMTQEFVAETIGVSRQSVSKWEQGLTDPSTSNLFALAKLFGVSVEELLKEIE